MQIKFYRFQCKPTKKSHISSAKIFEFSLNTVVVSMIIAVLWMVTLQCCQPLGFVMLYTDWSSFPKIHWRGAKLVLWLHAAQLPAKQKNTELSYSQREVAQHPAATFQACIHKTGDCASCRQSVLLGYQGV